MQGSRKRDASRPVLFDQIHADLVHLLRHRARPLRPLVGYLTDILHIAPADNVFTLNYGGPSHQEHQQCDANGIAIGLLVKPATGVEVTELSTNKQLSLS